MANLIYILVIDVPLIYIQSTFFAFSYFFSFLRVPYPNLVYPSFLTFLYIIYYILSIIITKIFVFSLFFFFVSFQTFYLIIPLSSSCFLQSSFTSSPSHFPSGLSQAAPSEGQRPSNQNSVILSQPAKRHCVGGELSQRELRARKLADGRRSLARQPFARLPEAACVRNADFWICCQFFFFYVNLTFSSLFHVHVSYSFFLSFNFLLRVCVFSFSFLFLFTLMFVYLTSYYHCHYYYY